MPNFMGVFETGPARYRDDGVHTYGNDPAYKISQRFLASLVGAVAIFLPVAMIAGFSFFGACFRYSISHFYYERVLGDVFVIGLAMIGTFLIAYRGTNPSESRLATIAGVSAFFVALFPTSQPGCSAELVTGRAFSGFKQYKGGVLEYLATGEGSLVPFLPFKWSEWLHYGSAAILFGFLAWYSFQVFTRMEDSSRVNKSGDPTPAKAKRNRIYNMTGSIILVCMVMLFAKMLIPDSTMAFAHPVWEKWTFVFETLALWAFGSAWLTKGRFGNRFMMDDSERKEMQRLSASRKK